MSADPTVLVLAGAGAVLAVGAFWHGISRNRQLWSTLRSLETRVCDAEVLAVNLLKSVRLAELADLRLAPRMPSQHGEDLVAWEFFGERRQGRYLDVGAHDGVNLSNTYFLESVGWDGILVEPNPALVESCRKSRPNSACVQAAVLGPREESEITLNIPEGGQFNTLAYTESTSEHQARVRRTGAAMQSVQVPLKTLNQVLDAESGPIAFVSIDVEGAELEVLKGFDLERFRPELMAIEENMAGASDEVRRYLAERGYVRRGRTGCNAFYTRREDDRLVGRRCGNVVLPRALWAPAEER